jgi:hypothetical protein
MTPDPKWLQIFKLEPGHSFSVALACGLFLAADHLGWFPPPAPWTTQLAWFGLFLFGCLWFVSLFAEILMTDLGYRR